MRPGGDCRIDVPGLPEVGDQRHPGRDLRSGQNHHRPEYRPTRLPCRGHTVLFTTAGQLLGELAALDSDTTLRYRLRRYAAPSLLVIDEVGYLSYSNRHADLLFELISRRHEKKSTLITTNKSFGEWSEVFPNAACVVALIDRLIHHAEIISLKGESYRHKEAQERAAINAKKRKSARTPS